MMPTPGGGTDASGSDFTAATTSAGRPAAVEDVNAVGVEEEPAIPRDEAERRYYAAIAELRRAATELIAKHGEKITHLFKLAEIGGQDAGVLLPELYFLFGTPDRQICEIATDAFDDSE